MTRRFLVAPMLHPAFILRGKDHLEPPQQAYMRRVAGYLRTGAEPQVDNPSLPPPGAKLLPTLKDLAQFRPHLTSCVVLDIENAGPYLLCIGLTALDLETFKVGLTLNLPFRLRGGARYWKTWSEHLQATEWLYEVLANPELAKAFHFGVTHDVPELERTGFEVRGRLLDTAVLAHAYYTELPLSLQWNSVLYAGATPWKHALRQGTEEKE